MWKRKRFLFCAVDLDSMGKGAFALCVTAFSGEMEEKMQKWVIYDDCGMDVFLDEIGNTNFNRAIQEIEKIWERMPEIDKKRRKHFELCLAEVDEDGEIIFESLDVCYSCK